MSQPVDTVLRVITSKNFVLPFWFFLIQLAIYAWVLFGNS